MGGGVEWWWSVVKVEVEQSRTDLDDVTKKKLTLMLKDKNVNLHVFLVPQR